MEKIMLKEFETYYLYGTFLNGRLITTEYLDK